ncbi:MAG: DNA recombination protein RmuC [Propionibacteriaceae bacterium]|jgi:DNA recombination protein RmuC|nr:DNA recombination protein RmuC [Propionibacteriaceae bacterium]
MKMSVLPAMIEHMDSYWVAIIAIASALLGALIAWLFAGSTTRTKSAETRADAEHWRADVTAAKLETAQLRTDVATAQAEAAAWRAEAEKARAEVATARSATATALAEREAAKTLVADARKDREAAQAQFKELSANIIKEQSAQVEADAKQRLERTEAMLNPVKENLLQLQNELAKTQQQRAALDAELKAQVSTVKTASEQLQIETKALATALSKPQTRGAWGEAQLKNVFEAAGMREHVDFATQFSSHNADERAIRPDARVELGDGRFVFVDSKVPMQAFLDALEKHEESERNVALKRVAKHVRAHIDGLSNKNYFTADSGTPEFVVLFIPHEAMAAEALYHDATLYEYAFERNIVLATPTTLIAMLKAIGYSWQQNALADNARRIGELGAELYKRTGTMTDAFIGLGRNIRQTVDAYNKTVGSFEGRLLPAARQMHQLGVAGDPLDELLPVAVEPREPKPTEIVAEPTSNTLQLGSSA